VALERENAKSFGGGVAIFRPATKIISRKYRGRLPMAGSAENPIYNPGTGGMLQIIKILTMGEGVSDEEATTSIQGHSKAAAAPSRRL
jgi:hypothetical protein